MPGNPIADNETPAVGAGYFGKMPARGDFLTHGLSRDFVDPWDDWVQLALEESQNRFSDQWLEIYLTSPVWHFAIAPAICGSTSWAGVLMPSVDAVGRYFPLTIAVPLHRRTNILTVFSSSEAWFAELEQLARSCLDDDFELDDFNARVRGLSAPDGALVPERNDVLDEERVRLSNAWRYGLGSMSHLSLDCPSLLHEMLERLVYSYSFWGTPGSTRVTPTYLLCQGLPPPQGFAAMLDGNWQKWGWDDRQILEPEHLAEIMNPVGD